MTGIELHGLEKTFTSQGKENRVLSGLDLTISAGEVVAIRGDNGIGKTTLLNIISGIDRPTKGSINFQGLGDDRPKIGYTQQDYTSSLLPWLNVIDNISIPLRLRGVSLLERRDRVKKLLDVLGFRGLRADGYPHQLSGGQKQRVAVARSLIHEPDLLLLDEPFANLDAHTSRDLQETLSRIHERSGTTILFVSHGLDQCVYLADRVVLLFGSPARVLREFAIPLPRPRKREIILGPAYAEIRSEILAEEEALYERSR
jgi:NitT/TauT family transport system ATP-binding protein